MPLPFSFSRKSLQFEVVIQLQTESNAGKFESLSIFFKCLFLESANKILQKLYQFLAATKIFFFLENPIFFHCCFEFKKFYKR